MVRIFKEKVMVARKVVLAYTETLFALLRLTFHHVFINRCDMVVTWLEVHV